VEAFTPAQQRVVLDGALSTLARERAVNFTGGIPFGGIDYAAQALQFGEHLNDADAISAVVDYLGDFAVGAHSKRRAATWLADRMDRLPGVDFERVRDAVATMQSQRDASTGSLPFRRMNLGGAPERLLLRLPHLEASVADGCVARLLMGDDQSRQDLASSLAHRPGYDLTLVALTHDDAFHVRSFAIMAMAYAIARGRNAHTALKEALDQALESSGPLVHAQVRTVVEAAASIEDSDTTTINEILRKVRDHAIR
jgi:hypothetical protein